MSSDRKIFVPNKSQDTAQQVQRDQRAFREQTKNIVRILNAKNCDKR